MTTTTREWLDLQAVNPRSTTTPLKGLESLLSYPKVDPWNLGLKLLEGADRNATADLAKILEVLDRYPLPSGGELLTVLDEKGHIKSNPVDIGIPSAVARQIAKLFLLPVIEPNRLRFANDQLNRQAMIFGPPGSGKTTVAAHMIPHVAGKLIQNANAPLALKTFYIDVYNAMSHASSIEKLANILRNYLIFAQLTALKMRGEKKETTPIILLILDNLDSPSPSATSTNDTVPPDMPPIALGRRGGVTFKPFLSRPASTPTVKKNVVAKKALKQVKNAGATPGITKRLIQTKLSLRDWEDFTEALAEWFNEERLRTTFPDVRVIWTVRKPWAIPKLLRNQVPFSYQRWLTYPNSASRRLLLQQVFQNEILNNLFRHLQFRSETRKVILEMKKDEKDNEQKVQNARALGAPTAAAQAEIAFGESKLIQLYQRLLDQDIQRTPAYLSATTNLPNSVEGFLNLGAYNVQEGRLLEAIERIQNVPPVTKEEFLRTMRNLLQTGRDQLLKLPDVEDLSKPPREVNDMAERRLIVLQYWRTYWECFTPSIEALVQATGRSSSYVSQSGLTKEDLRNAELIFANQDEANKLADDDISKSYFDYGASNEEILTICNLIFAGADREAIRFGLQDANAMIENSFLQAPAVCRAEVVARQKKTNTELYSSTAGAAVIPSTTIPSPHCIILDPQTLKSKAGATAHYVMPFATMAGSHRVRLTFENIGFAVNALLASQTTLGASISPFLRGNGSAFRQKQTAVAMAEYVWYVLTGEPSPNAATVVREQGTNAVVNVRQTIPDIFLPGAIASISPFGPGWLTRDVQVQYATQKKRTPKKGAKLGGTTAIISIPANKKKAKSQQRLRDSFGRFMPLS